MVKPEQASAGPLQRIRVIDLTLFLSGPYGTQILGDLGAEVIKVEPLDGDNTRYLPSHFIGKDSAYYCSVNRNKKSVALNYKTAEGGQLLEQMITTADVFIENLKPGALARYGITPNRMRELNPRLVYCSISGFGQDGPDRLRPAYDMAVQALSGGMSLTGEEGGKPVRSGIPLADISAGMYAVIGILAALEERRNTGVGKLIDVAMLDCQIAMLSYQAAYYLASGRVPGPQGRGHESIPTYRAFTAGDGCDFVICANTDRMWRSLCDVIGKPELKDDPRLSDRTGRYAHRDEIWAALEAAFLSRPASAWVDAMVKADIPVGTVNTLDRTLNSAQVRHRGMVMTLQDENDRTLSVAGNPLKFPERRHAPPEQFPPRLGQHTREIVGKGLDVDDGTIEKLIDAGVLGIDDATNKEVLA
jgi:crotonobetainyl-CoA:carnitine CoA-transferase CaiB-like acyl-CoA transferase